MAFTPTQQREYREKLKKQGICTLCHKVKTKKGHVVCQACNDRCSKNRKVMLTAPNRCPMCLNIIDEFTLIRGGKTCAFCLERSHIRNHRKRSRI